MESDRRYRRFAAGALAVAASLVLTSCSSGSTGVHLQTLDSSTSAAVNVASPTGGTSSPSSATGTTPRPSQPVVSSASSSSSSTSSSSPTSAPSTTKAQVTAPTTDKQWPADFTAGQKVYAKAALAAFDGFVQVSTKAEKQPGKDWTKEIRKYAADPTAAKTLDDLASLATANVHATTTETYEAARVISATEKEVVLQSCIDGSKAAIADASGKKVDLRPSPHPRAILKFNIYQYGPKVGGWLVRETVAPTPAEPC